MNLQTLPSLGALLLLAPFASATIIHQWTFADPSGTLISEAANSGTVGGVAFVNSANPTSAWTTDGAGRLLMLNDTGTTLHQFRANMGPSITGLIRYEHQVSWNFTSGRANPNEVYLITRPDTGATPNLFRWTMENPSGGALFRLNIDGAGISGTGLNNVTFNQGDLALGSSGQLWLRTDYTLSDTQLTGIDAYWSVDGITWNQVALTYAAQNVTNIGDLRIHGKGNYDANNWHAIDSVTVTIIPEPSVYAALLGILGLGSVLLRRRKIDVCTHAQKQRSGVL